MSVYVLYIVKFLIIWLEKLPSYFHYFITWIFAHKKHSCLITIKTILLQILLDSSIDTLHFEKNVN